MPRWCDVGGPKEESDHEPGDGVHGEPACGRRLAREDKSDGKPVKEHGGIGGPRGRGDGEVGAAREGARTKTRDVEGVSAEDGETCARKRPRRWQDAAGREGEPRRKSWRTESGRRGVRDGDEDCISAGCDESSNERPNDEVQLQARPAVWIRSFKNPLPQCF